MLTTPIQNQIGIYLEFCCRKLSYFCNFHGKYCTNDSPIFFLMVSNKSPQYMKNNVAVG